MIERVEVLRGGGSALFGSSAIGGTINVITREPSRTRAQMSHTLTSLGGSNSYDNNDDAQCFARLRKRPGGHCVFGQSRHRSGYDHDGDGFTELPVINSQSVGMRSFFRTGAYSRITAQYHHIDELPPGGDLLDRPPHEAFVAEQTDHSIDGEAFRSTSRRPTAATTSMPTPRFRTRRARVTTAANRTPTPTARRTI